VEQARKVLLMGRGALQSQSTPNFEEPSSNTGKPTLFKPQRLRRPYFSCKKIFASKDKFPATAGRP
jgi:hypothetical protein